jgi:hypothetical protein
MTRHFDAKGHDVTTDTYVGNIRSAVMDGIGPSTAILGTNFKEKFLTPSATHNSMTKRHSLHGIKSSESADVIGRNAHKRALLLYILIEKSRDKSRRKAVNSFS